MIIFKILLILYCGLILTSSILVKVNEKFEIKILKDAEKCENINNISLIMFLILFIIAVLAIL